jgi:hypothetical protein
MIMHLHIVYQGNPTNIIPLISWCKSINATYFLTHLAIDDMTAIDFADEVLRPKRFWDTNGNALIHTWEQPVTADSFRIFKQMTYSMNCAGASRLNRDLKGTNPVDAVVYFNAFVGAMPFIVPKFDKLSQDEIIAGFTDQTGEVSFFFFITRPHNYDRISYLWKRNNIPTPLNTPAEVTNKTVWWKWIRLLGLKVTKI